MEEEFVEGNLATKIKLLVLLGIFIAVLFVTTSLSEKYENARETDNIAELQDTISLLQIFLPIEAVILGYFAILSLYLSFRVKKSGSWPPPGMRAAFRTRVRRGGYATVMWMTLILAGCIFIVEVYLKFYEWHLIYKVYKVLKWLSL